MERIRDLDRFQKIILVMLLAMAIIFGVTYWRVTGKVGFMYQDTVLPLTEENGNRIYSGEIRGTSAVFTVTADKTVTFQYGDRRYGPYTAKLDPTAVPEDSNLAEYMTGFEVLENGEVFYRGGVMDTGTDSGWMLFDEDGTYGGVFITATMSVGTVVDGDGNVVDTMKPRVYDILSLMEGPELTHKGMWIGWFGGLFISLMTAVSILFADELFRWSLLWRVRDVDSAEPSDWFLATRYIGWMILPVMAFALYMVGLR